MDRPDTIVGLVLHLVRLRAEAWRAARPAAIRWSPARVCALGALIALAALTVVWLEFGQTVRVRVRHGGPSCSEIAAFSRAMDADRARLAASPTAPSPASH